MKRAAALLIATSTAVVLFGDPMWALCAALVAVAVVWLLDPAAVRAGLHFGALLAIIFAASITAAVVAWAEGPERAITLGGMVLLRLLVLAFVAGLLVRSVDAEALLQVTRKMGLERLGLVLGLALNSLPRITEAAAQVWTASKVRSDGALERFRRLPGVGEVLLAHTARIAEEATAAAALRGHSALIRPAGSRLEAPLRVVVVTGPTGGGKTEAVIAVADALRERGIPVAGFVQVGTLEDGRKTGFSLRDLATDEEAVLASLADRDKGDFGTRFRFSDEGFRLGRQALSQATPASVVIIDELGPVELRGQGHMQAVRDALATPALRGAIIVVRRTLVPSLLAELDASDAVVVDVEGKGDHTVESIIAAFTV